MNCSYPLQGEGDAAGGRTDNGGGDHRKCYSLYALTPEATLGDHSALVLFAFCRRLPPMRKFCGNCTAGARELCLLRAHHRDSRAPVAN